MSALIKLIKSHINEKEFFENEVKKHEDSIKELCSQLELSDIESLSYDELKEFYSSIRYKCTDEIREIYENQIAIKKAEKYPALKQATYYPIINTLDISDEEKVKLDKIAKSCYRYTIYENSLVRHGLTPEIVALFVQLGIAEESISFSCPRCGMCVNGMEKETFAKHLRCWKLEAKETLSDEEQQELKDLWDDDSECYGIITYECYHCDSYDGEDTVCVEINSMEEYLKAVEKEIIERCYSFKIKPDRTYDEL